MKATKIFMMAALALTFAACSNDDNDFAQQPDNNEITITATVSSDDATTRALSPNGSNIASTWETTDEFAILFNDGSNNVKRTATVQSINGSNVTITFTIPESLASNTACTIVYPASAANAANTGADVATALAAQDGTIGNWPEVRVGTATIDKDNHSLSSVTKLTAQNAIFKFTLQDLSDAAKSATEFKVSDNSGNVITTVTPGSASGELYVALPVMAAGTYWFNATIDSKPYIAKATTAAATVAGKYYQTTVKMATIGDVILDNGKFAAPSSTGTKVAIIAYVGSETGESAYNHGLAIAMKDANNAYSTMWMYNNSEPHYSKVNPNQYTDIAAALAAKESGSSLSSGKNTGTYPAFQAALANSIATETGISAAAPATGTSGWFMPSIFQWNQIVNGLTGTTTPFTTDTNSSLSYTAVNPKITAAGGVGLNAQYYWSSTEYDSNYAWKYAAIYGMAQANPDSKGTYVYVRAAFAF